jgi:hypothetical protein
MLLMTFITLICDLAHKRKTGLALTLPNIIKANSHETSNRNNWSGHGWHYCGCTIADERQKPGHRYY